MCTTNRICPNFEPHSFRRLPFSNNWHFKICHCHFRELQFSNFCKSRNPVRHAYFIVKFHELNFRRLLAIHEHREIVCLENLDVQCIQYLCVWAQLGSPCSHCLLIHLFDLYPSNGLDRTGTASCHILQTCSLIGSAALYHPLHFMYNYKWVCTILL